MAAPSYITPFFIEGFDGLPTGGAIREFFTTYGKWDGAYDSGGTISGSSHTPYAYGGSLTLAGASLKKTLQIPCPEQATVAFNLSYEGSGICDLVRLYDTDLQYRVTLGVAGGSGTFTSYDAIGNPTSFAPFPMDTGTFYSVQVGVDFHGPELYMFVSVFLASDVTGNTGTVDGPVFSGVVNTWTSGVVDYFVIGGTGGATLTFDDVYFTQSFAPSNHVPYRVYSLPPVADVNNSGWVPTPGNSVWQNLIANPVSGSPYDTATSTGASFEVSFVQFTQITESDTLACALTLVTNTSGEGALVYYEDGYEESLASPQFTSSGYPGRFQGYVLTTLLDIGLLTPNAVNLLNGGVTALSSNLSACQLLLEVLCTSGTPEPIPVTSTNPQYLADLLYNVTDPQFWFQNSNHHVLIVSAVNAYNGTVLTSNVLYPIDSSDSAALQTWLQSHQQSHDAMNQVFNLASPDLTKLDLSDANGTNLWNQQHLDGHRQVVVSLSR